MPMADLSRLSLWVPALNNAMSEFEINTPVRVAMFLAQVAHESGQLRYMEEIASGAAYEGRADLGNSQPGDGMRFKGHGPIQITGRDMHARCSIALYGSPDALLTDPRRICTAFDGARSAAWFWSYKNLNRLADQGNYRAVTKRINGGLNGFDDRLELLNRAMKAIPGAKMQAMKGKIGTFIVNRLAEPSSHRSIAVACTAIGVKVSPEHLVAILNIGALTLVALGLLPDKLNTEDEA